MATAPKIYDADLTGVLHLVCPDDKLEFTYTPAAARGVGGAAKGALTVDGVDASDDLPVDQRTVKTVYAQCPAGHSRPYQARF